MDQDRRLPRRRFLKTTASLGAGGAAGLGGEGAARAAVTGRATSKPGAKPKHETRNVREGIIYNRLGRTNFMVSALSFGGYRLSPKSLTVFDAAVRRGVNFIMAHAGNCTKALGEWFKTPGNRQRIFLGLRADGKSIDTDLKAMNTDCVDLLIVGIHKPQSVASEDVRRRFEAMKKAGKARYLCLVFHGNLPGVWKEGVKAGWYDVLLSPYNFPSRPDLKPLIPAARARDIGLMAMKGARAVPKGKDFVSACRTFLADGLATVLKTIQDTKQLADCLRLAAKGDATAPAKAAQIDCAGQCTLCGACSPCADGVAVQDILRTYQYYLGDLGCREWALGQYAAIPFPALATACTDCGRCEAVCPQHLPIRSLIRRAHVELELELARS